MSMDLSKLHTAQEASLLLGKEASYVKQLINKYPERLKPGTYRKLARTFIITDDGIEYLRTQIKA